VRSTGIGSWPGTDMQDATKIALAECPDLPYLPELPVRGPHAALIGRGTAFLSGLGVELHASGWRLTDASGRDHRRAVATLRSDLDVLEEEAQGYSGVLKIAAVGPWTLAAALEHPRGDKVLADRGARRDLAQSLAEGLVAMVEELRRRLPDVAVIIQLDEPSLPAVLTGRVPTASGLARHRSIDVPEASTAVSVIIDRLGAVAVETWVHCCAAGAPVELLHRAGAAAVFVDQEQLGPAEWDSLGSAMEAGLRLGLGVVPTGKDVAGLTADQVAERALRALRPLDLPPEITHRTVLTPACGLAGFRPEQAVDVLRSLARAAGIVSEQLAG
jgi:methionine synthase II (cobalamin-independent)